MDPGIGVANPQGSTRMPADTRTLQEKLAEADRHINHAEDLIARQRNIVADLQRDGHDLEKAQALLSTMIEALEQMYRHRSVIEAELAREG